MAFNTASLNTEDPFRLGRKRKGLGSTDERLQSDTMAAFKRRMSEAQQAALQEAIQQADENERIRMSPANIAALTGRTGGSVSQAIAEETDRATRARAGAGGTLKILQSLSQGGTAVLPGFNRSNSQGFKRRKPSQLDMVNQGLEETDIESNAERIARLDEEYDRELRRRFGGR